VQPFAGAALAFVGIPLVDPGGSALSFALAFAIAAGLVTLCVALPLVAWLLTRGPLRLRTILLSGVVLGNVPIAIMLVLAVAMRQPDAGPMWSGPAEAIRVLATGSIFGLAGATLFWLISIRGTAMERG
jgi:hypothetical protein